MITSEATNTTDALELSVEQEVAEQLDQYTREFIAGLENQISVKFTEEEVAEVMVMPEDDEDDEDEDEDEESEDEDETA